MRAAWPTIVTLCVLSTVTTLLATSVAAAQSTLCTNEKPPRDKPLIAPPDGATAVARNTLIQVDLDATLEPKFRLFRVPPVIDPRSPPPPDVPVEATWQRIDDSDRFVIRPTELLDANTSYRTNVRARAGLDNSFVFKTSALVDTKPPTFKFGQDEVTDYTSTSCGDEGDGFRISLNFDNATDDGNEGGIEYLVYLTRAEGLDGPRLLLRQYRVEGTGIVFVLEPEQLASSVCVLVDAVDGVGNHAIDVEEFCFDPLQGNFFEPCAVGGDLGRQGRGFFGLILVSLLALSVRRRRLRKTAQR